MTFEWTSRFGSNTYLALGVSNNRRMVGTDGSLILTAKFCAIIPILSILTRMKIRIKQGYLWASIHFLFPLVKKIYKITLSFVSCQLSLLWETPLDVGGIGSCMSTRAGWTGSAVLSEYEWLELCSHVHRADWISLQHQVYARKDYAWQQSRGLFESCCGFAQPPVWWIRPINIDLAFFLLKNKSSDCGIIFSCPSTRTGSRNPALLKLRSD